jgi:hypothetical protein
MGRLVRMQCHSPPILKLEKADGRFDVIVPWLIDRKLPQQKRIVIWSMEDCS